MTIGKCYPKLKSIVPTQKKPKPYEVNLKVNCRHCGEGEVMWIEIPALKFALEQLKKLITALGTREVDLEKSKIKFKELKTWFNKRLKFYRDKLEETKEDLIVLKAEREQHIRDLLILRNPNRPDILNNQPTTNFYSIEADKIIAKRTEKPREKPTPAVMNAKIEVHIDENAIKEHEERAKLVDWD